LNLIINDRLSVESFSENWSFDDFSSLNWSLNDSLSDNRLLYDGSGYNWLRDHFFGVDWIVFNTLSLIDLRFGVNNLGIEEVCVRGLRGSI